MPKRTFNKDMLHLRALKVKNAEAGARKSAADKAFKQHQTHCLARMEIEDVPGITTGGTLFSRVTKVKGSVDDRSQYVRYALEQDEGVSEFLREMGYAVSSEATSQRQEDEAIAKMREKFFATVTSLAMLDLKEKGDLCNQQANAHVDDGAPLPPGLTFRPDSYVSQRVA